MNKLESPTSVTEMDRILDSLRPNEALSPELHTKIRDRLIQELQPVTPLRSAKSLTIQLSAVFLILATGLIALLGTAGFHSLHFGQAAGITILLGIGVLLLSVSLAWQMKPVSSQRTSAKLAGVCFALGFVAGAALLFPWRGLDRFVTEGWPCAATGFAVALPAALLFGLIVRRGVPMSHGAFGSAVGAIAALLGVTALQFRCPHQHAAHLIVWHGSILVASMIVGYLLARIATRSRASQV
jgi:hypothetical protein